MEESLRCDQTNADLKGKRHADEIDHGRDEKIQIGGNSRSGGGDQGLSEKQLDRIVRRFKRRFERYLKNRKSESEFEYADGKFEKMHLQHAGSALAWYNETKNENFEVVKFMEYQTFDYRVKREGVDEHPKTQFWKHMTFKAKPKNGADSSTQLFFAELILCTPRHVTICEIFDPEDLVNRSECRFCGDDSTMFHPIGCLQETEEKFFIAKK